MPDATIKLLNKSPLTHDTNRYVFSRPANFDFAPGQAAELAIAIDGWRDEGRPFTFTSQPEDDFLEFVIKSYPDHDGMTEKLAQVDEGTKFAFDGPFGAIEDCGAGVFLAAGAGITPFIPILRRRAQAGTIKGCTLVFSNKTEADIILREEWEQMQGLKVVFTVTDEKSTTLKTGRVEADFLCATVADLDQKFYVCGPEQFVSDVRSGLRSMGVKSGQIVTEEGW